MEAWDSYHRRLARVAQFRAAFKAAAQWPVGVEEREKEREDKGKGKAKEGGERKRRDPRAASVEEVEDEYDVAWRERTANSDGEEDESTTGPEGKKKRSGLRDEAREWYAAFEERVDEVAAKHGVSKKVARAYLSGASERAKKDKRGYNERTAKVWWHLKEYNKDPPNETKIGMSEAHTMYSQREFDNISREWTAADLEQLRADYLAAHQDKEIEPLSGVAAARDAAKIARWFQDELVLLERRTGARGFVVIAPSSVSSTIRVHTLGSENSMRFFPEQLRKEAHVFGNQFSVWACADAAKEEASEAEERVKPEGATELRKEVSNELTRQLSEITGFHYTSMPYSTFKASVSAARGINVRGWPDEVQWGTPSNFSGPATQQVGRIWDLLFSGVIHFYHMGKEEWDDVKAEVAEEKKEKKAAKKLAKEEGKKEEKKTKGGKKAAGKKKKQEEEEEEEEPPKKKKKKQARFKEVEEEEPEAESTPEPPSPKPKAKGKGKGRAKGGKEAEEEESAEEEEETRRSTRGEKRKRVPEAPATDDGEDEVADESDEAPPKKSKTSAATRATAAPVKKSKSSSSATSATAAPVKKSKSSSATPATEPKKRKAPTKPLEDEGERARKRQRVEVVIKKPAFKHRRKEFPSNSVVGDTSSEQEDGGNGGKGGGNSGGGSTSGPVASGSGSGGGDGGVVVKSRKDMTPMEKQDGNKKMAAESKARDAARRAKAGSSKAPAVAKTPRKSLAEIDRAGSEEYEDSDSSSD
ncbi:hypothetical protein R3P38DRAFT_2763037 [Favolaschia claudopus]|uniref:Uncharacterized protein n=1 Tax=Favolaschia claudopus TaxID=2862362 RepID=A0AAW0DPE5_9AGAR